MQNFFCFVIKKKLFNSLTDGVLLPPRVKKKKDIIINSSRDRQIIIIEEEEYKRDEQKWKQCITPEAEMRSRYKLRNE